MKKKIIILSIIFTLCLILLVSIKIQTTPASITSPQGNVVKFWVSGCDNCSNLYYCIDGSIWGNPGTCAFTWQECEAGSHSIFVSCYQGKSQIHYFSCRGTGGVQDEYITVISNGPTNPCQDKK